LNTNDRAKHPGISGRQPGKQDTGGEHCPKHGFPNLALVIAKSHHH